MGLFKETYLDVLEEMIADYIEENPKVTWEEAYNFLADKAYDATVDRVAERVDNFKNKMKDV